MKGFSEISLSDDNIDYSLHTQRLPLNTLSSSDLDSHSSFNTNHYNSVRSNTTFHGIISSNPRMKEVFQMVKKVAKSTVTVLITGESGTGKELIAKALHRESGREGKFIPINCGAIPEHLLESELFGHVKGAFTGATDDKQGKFLAASGGTILLDEIGEMSKHLQVKLLRVLQEKIVRPVGSTEGIPINVRIIAATNRDLLEQVKSGLFRKDLYYRLQVVPIELPSLRERNDDILSLVQYFLKKGAEKIGNPNLRFSQKILDSFLEYKWPGNIRELENIVERCVVLSKGDLIQPESLPKSFLKSNQCKIPNVSIENTGINLKSLLDEFETKLILQALEKTAWNKKQAADLLSLKRTTLVEKIKKKGLQEFHARGLLKK